MTTRPVAITLLAGMLLAGAASAQNAADHQLLPSRGALPIVQRPINVNPIRVDLPGDTRPRLDEPLSEPAHVVNMVVSKVVEVVHRVTESWLPNAGNFGLRDRLVSLGVYDR